MEGLLVRVGGGRFGSAKTRGKDTKMKTMEKQMLRMKERYDEEIVELKKKNHNRTQENEERRGGVGEGDE